MQCLHFIWGNAHTVNLVINILEQNPRFYKLDGITYCLGSVRLRATSIALQRFETGLVSSSIFCHGLKIKHPQLNLLDTNQNLLKPFKIHLQFKIQNKKNCKKKVTIHHKKLTKNGHYPLF